MADSLRHVALDILGAHDVPAQAGWPSRRVRLGIAGLGAVAQAVHLPLVERLRDTFAIGAIADLSPTLTAAIGDRFRVAADRRFGTVEEIVEAPGLDGLSS